MRGNSPDGWSIYFDILKIVDWQKPADDQIKLDGKKVRGDHLRD
jgi:hypothetical protein